MVKVAALKLVAAWIVPVVTEAGVTVKLNGCELPPPGDGLVTTTGNVPAVAKSELLSVMDSWLALLNVAACNNPLNVTDEEAMNPLPAMVTARACAPAFVELGDREEMVGVGFGTTTACTTKLCAAESPAASGFLAVTA
jgi:hypothetical protein